MGNTIISGGQTGAERAALDWAIAHCLPHGGWCPKGRGARDGPLPSYYKLRETPTNSLVEKMDWNVRDSEATIVFTLSPVASGGSLRTAFFAGLYGRHILHLHPGIPNLPRLLATFASRVHKLNITGSTETEEPGIYMWVGRTLNLAILPPQFELERQARRSF